MLGEWRAAGQVIWVKNISLLTSLFRCSLLGEMLIVHQVWVVGVFSSLWQRQRVLQRMREETNHKYMITSVDLYDIIHAIPYKYINGAKFLMHLAHK